jgi:curli biogenesis system outer membrane secretion channel CsgG
MFLFKNSKVSTLMVAVTFLSFMFSFLTAADASPKRIGVTKFETNNLTVLLDNGGQYDIGLGASDLLATELSKNRNFEVIEREQIRSILQEQAFGASGAVDDTTAAQIGKLAGLKYIVYGKILSAGGERTSNSIMGLTVNQLKVKVQIAVRMIDVNTGVIAWADQVDGVVTKTGGSYGNMSSRTGVSASIYDEALNIAIKKIVNAVNQQAPTEGSIVKVSGQKIYLDLGNDQGVQVGQTFSVVREGEVITNAAGQIIGVDKTNVGTIKIVSVDGQMSIAEIQGKASLPMQQGDKVRAN